MISEAFLPIRKILKSSFIKDVGILTSGSVVAQLIGIAAVPILSRYYTPHQFGIFGSVSSIFSVLTVIAALRYHLAIVLPDNDSEALNLFALSTICVFLMASLAAAIFWVFKMEIASDFNIPEAAS